MPRLSSAFFKTALLFLFIGIAMGFQMSISGVHNVTGAHAHLNLLGWVTMSIFGFYYALNPQKAENRIGILHFWTYVSGVAVMTVSLYFMLQGNDTLEPLVAIGSVIVAIGVILFAVVVFSPDPVRRSQPQARAEAR